MAVTLSLAPVPGKPLVPAYLTSYQRDLLEAARGYRDSGQVIPETFNRELQAYCRSLVGRGPCYPHFYRTVTLLASEQHLPLADPDLFRRRIEELYRDSPPRVVAMHMQALRRTYPLAAVLVPPGAWEGV